MSHEEEEKQLSVIAKNKQNVDRICKTTLSWEDPDAYFAEIDGIELGLSQGKSKKQIWAVEFSQDLFAIFIERNYKDVEDKLNSLPDRFTDEQKRVICSKVRELIPHARLVYFENDSDECCFVVNALDNHHNQRIDGARLACLIDPKKYIKRIPRGAVS